MRLNEVRQDHQNPQEDEFSQSEKLDTRRSRLTLQHLNKLRKIREIRKLENEERRELFKKIYQRPSAAI